MVQHSQNTYENTIFVPHGCNLCAFCVHVLETSTCGSYSPKHGDNPRYPNLAKIPKITRCSSPWSWMIFFFLKKKIAKRKKILFALHDLQKWTYVSKYPSDCYKTEIWCKRIVCAPLLHFWWIFEKVSMAGWKYFGMSWYFHPAIKSIAKSHQKWICDALISH